METTVKQRLTDFIQSEGISVRNFERRCGLSSNYLRSLRHTPSEDKLSAILEAFPYLDRLRAAVLPDRLARVRDLFIFCAYTGLAYSDSQCVEFFEVVDISGARFIDATRRKTGTRFLTPLLAPAEAVLRRYGGRLPLISNQRANVYLHEVERRLGFRKPLTTHVARHTFATTVALANGVPIETLSRMLGHRDIHTTQIYARVLAQSVADDGAALAAKIR